MNAPSVFSPSEIDCHIHAGMERNFSLEVQFQAMVDAGRKVVGLVDHGEIYGRDIGEWAEGKREIARTRLDGNDGLADLAPVIESCADGPAGFYRSLREAARGWEGRLKVFVGIELGPSRLIEGDLDPATWCEGADFIGICAQEPSKGCAWGRFLAGALDGAGALRGDRDMGIVLHHPFRRIRTMPDPIPDAGGFTEEDAALVAEALERNRAVAELNFDSFFSESTRTKRADLLGPPERYEAMIAAARSAACMLRRAGGRFSIGSDCHGLPKPGDYRPEVMMEALGVGIDSVELPHPFSRIARLAKQ